MLNFILRLLVKLLPEREQHKSIIADLSEERDRQNKRIKELEHELDYLEKKFAEQGCIRPCRFRVNGLQDDPAKRQRKPKANSKRASEASDDTTKQD